MPTNPVRRKWLLAWGGYCDDKLSTWAALDTGDQLAVFKTRKEARRRFQDVRRIAIKCPAIPSRSRRAR